MESTRFVDVAVRLRQHSTNIVKGIEYVNEDPPCLLVAGKQKSYYFNNIFTEHTDQKSVFNLIVKPRIQNVIDGYNCTIFAYGQTGTGKSYTMGTDYLNNSDDMGLIPRIFEHLFLKADMEVCISYFEVYNSKMYDLLSTNKILSPVKTVQQLTKEKIVNPQQAQDLLNQGCLNRRIASTKQNLKSSRSHAVLTIYCSTRSEHCETLAKLNLVDLAGLESVKKTGTEGMQFEEGVRINKDLLSIGKVLYALSTNQMYIPYRDSKLTNLLKDSLNSNNYVTLIACISSNFEDIGASLHTLEFAENAKGVRIEPELNIQIFEDISNIVKATPHKTFFKPSRCSTIRKLKNISFNNKPRGQSLVADFTKGVPPSPIVKENSKIGYLKNFLPPIVNTVKDSPKISRSELKSEFNRLFREELSQLWVTSNLADCNCGTEETVFKKPKILPKKTKPYLDVPVRQSLRLCLRECTKESSLLEENINKSLNKNSIEVEIAESKIFRNSCSLNESNNNTINNNTLRRSTRLSERKCSVALEKTIDKREFKNKTLLSLQRNRKMKKVDSPQIINKKSMEIYILNILNNGDEKKLQTLQTVGAKTAKLICLYRKMNGKFKTLRDVSKIPWKGESYKRFLTCNLL